MHLFLIIKSKWPQKKATTTQYFLISIPAFKSFGQIELN